MGVHITFVRSTNLDSWTWPQLRLMKMGGNGAATDFFAAHGGNVLLSPSTEGKTKYTSAVAQKYKEELNRRAQQDAGAAGVRAPFTLPGVLSGSSVSAKPKSGDDIDFFDEWDSTTPTNKSMPEPAPPIGETPLAEAAATSAAADHVTTASPVQTQTPVPAIAPSPATARPVSSATLRAKARPTGTLGAVRGGSGTSLSARPTKLGLGVRKASTPINFDEAERKMKMEQAQAAQAAQAAKVEQEKAAQVAAADEVKTSAFSRDELASDTTKELPRTQAKPTTNLKGNAGVDRLGMGFTRLGIAQARNNASMQQNKSAAATGSPDSNESNYARKNFASQKSISSDQYFQRGGYDPNLSEETKMRLASFQGQTSISSNQYFGREEEEEDDLSVEHDDFSDLEASARAYYRKIMSNPDVQNGIEKIRTGALKLSQYLEDLSRNGA